jgi:FHS family Na+ dependent glucose MFS transporter 1
VITPPHRQRAVCRAAAAGTDAMANFASLRGPLGLNRVYVEAPKGALDVGCNTLLLWLHNEKVGPFMNGLHACFGIGAFIAPLIAASVLKSTSDIYWVYWVFAIAAFPIAFFVWRMPSPQTRAVPEEHKDAPLPILPVAIMVACFALYVGAEAGYGNLIYTYAFQRGLSTESTANYLTSAF